MHNVMYVVYKGNKLKKTDIFQTDLFLDTVNAL